MSSPLRAATVIVLRPAQNDPRDVEVLFVRRGARASFMANAYVFPGGRVDDADAQSGLEHATRLCAARELTEEAGLRVAHPSEFVYFARWITPSQEPKRFDADFFLWAMPADQAPEVDAKEVFDLRWYTPAAALAEYEAGKLNLPPPTVCTVEELLAEVKRLPADAAVLPSLLSACRARKPRAVLPRMAATPEGGMELVMPWDADYASVAGEGEIVLEIAEGGAAVPSRIRRCTLVPPGIWKLDRLS